MAGGIIGLSLMGLSVANRVLNVEQSRHKHAVPVGLAVNTVCGRITVVALFQRLLVNQVLSLAGNKNVNAVVL